MSAVVVLVGFGLFVVTLADACSGHHTHTTTTRHGNPDSMFSARMHAGHWIYMRACIMHARVRTDGASPALGFLNRYTTVHM